MQGRSSENFKRLEMMVGGEGMERLAAARVGVYGLGAVGSFAVEALVRCGVGNLKLVDFDQIRGTNINRQLFALNSTIGKNKVELAAARAMDINPAVRLEPVEEFFHKDTAEVLLAGIDYVIDAIDSLNPKVMLILAARARKLTVVTSMGAARRFDPLLVRVTDISKVTHDPLAAKVRKRLHRAGVYTGVTAVWSSEPVTGAAETDGEQPGEESYSRGRVRDPLPSIIFGPASFGLAAAHHVVRAILSNEFHAHE